ARLRRDQAYRIRIAFDEALRAAGLDPEGEARRPRLGIEIGRDFDELRGFGRQLRVFGDARTDGCFVRLGLDIGFRLLERRAEARDLRSMRLGPASGRRIDHYHRARRLDIAEIADDVAGLALDDAAKERIHHR